MPFSSISLAHSAMFMAWSPMRSKSPMAWRYLVTVLFCWGVSSLPVSWMR